MSETFDCTADAEFRRGVVRAAAVLSRGGVALLPADSSYALAADAFDPAAVRTMLHLKGSDRSVPVPVLIASAETLSGLVETITPAMAAAAERFWPGGLTMVVRSAPTLAWDLGQTESTVALRVPQHPVIRAVVEKTGPLAVLSANAAAGALPLSVPQALTALGNPDDIEVILDAGALDGAPRVSSIVDLTGPEPRWVRDGEISADDVMAVMPTQDGIEAASPPS